jgi:hypothetical protein
MKCPECRGKRTIVHPDLSVWTQDDIAEDPESFEAMMQGRYDIRCPACKGEGVVDPEEYAFDLEYRREVEAERRMGA